MRTHARLLATGQRVGVRHGGRRGFFPRLAENLKVLQEARDVIASRRRAGMPITEAARWLIDNFHIVETQFSQVGSRLSLSYYRRLPKLAVEPLEGLPRIYGLAWSFVAHSDSVLDVDALRDFLKAYQTTTALQAGELWALQVTLQAVLLENLRRISEWVVLSEIAADLVGHLFDLPEQDAPDRLDLLLHTNLPAAAVQSIVGMVQNRLSHVQTRTAQRINDLFDRRGIDADRLTRDRLALEARDNVTVRNIFSSLRSSGSIEWRPLLSQVCSIDTTLATLCRYDNEHPDTHDQYRYRIELLARSHRCAEAEVAHKVVALCMRDGPQIEQSPSYYLMGAGAATLAASLGQARAVAFSRAAMGPQAKLVAYIATLASATLALALLLTQDMSAAGTRLITVLLLLLPLSEIVISLANRLVVESAPLQRLPRMNFSDGIPADHAALVAVPAILGSLANVDQLVRQLERHHLSSKETNVQYVLLSDWRDADSETASDDAALLAHAISRLKALNHRHGVGDRPPRFLLLHRQRAFSETEQRWIGWERKRGKIEQLIRLLNGEANQWFVPAGDPANLMTGVRFLMILDADTALPPASLRNLCAIAAHPMNRPLVDAERRAVVAGYGILQPRVAVPFEPTRKLSVYHWLFAGQTGLDSYAAAVSEVYQDLFGEGTFIGKGLIDVAAAYVVLDRRLPDDTVLSHDLLEGSLMRCAFASDVELLEGYPRDPATSAARRHRWMRGDWQLLPFFGRAKLPRLQLLSRWKMFDNLRRSLLAPACLALIAVSAAGGTDRSDFFGPDASIAVVLLAFGLGPVLGAGAAMLPTRQRIALGVFLRRAGSSLLRAVAGASWRLATLLFEAILATDAIARTVWRLAVSRRHLMQWVASDQLSVRPAGHGTRSLNPPPGAAAARRRPGGVHVATAIVAIASIVAAVAAGSPQSVALIATVWGLVPLWHWLALRRPRTAFETTSASEREYLRAVAVDSWQYFASYVNPSTNHLPPDNVQFDSSETVANRTSPTNIGMYLLSAAAAREFGLLTDDELADRIDATFQTMARMPRYRGHFYNWLRTDTLEILPPAYISAVDSGNLVGHLFAVANACEQFASQASPASGRLLNLAALAREFARSTDFGFLYDPKTRLFSIGLREDSGMLDDSFYDLLPSEARLLSYLAIAKGDAPLKHWNALGRIAFAFGSGASLKSWSGSMFEYIMPSLVMDEPPGTLIRESIETAIRVQISHGRNTQRPWGVSESAYFARDSTQAFQYSPFGSAELALKNLDPDEYVVAPYASCLAAMFQPSDATANLKRIESLGGRSRWGFFEAVDYTARRQPGSAEFSVVQAIMAHHQGMSLTALCNLLCADAPRRWFAGEPMLAAHRSLLQEAASAEVALSVEARSAGGATMEGFAEHNTFHHRFDPDSSVLPRTLLISNGRYSVSFRSNGCTASRWNGLAVSRARDDLLRDEHGTQVHIRPDTGQPRANTAVDGLSRAQPSWIRLGGAGGADGERPSVEFSADRGRIVQRVSLCDVTMSVWVAPEDDIEFRDIELHNRSGQRAELALRSALEPVSADPASDEAHTAFAKLFIEIRWDDEISGWIWRRRPRRPDEPARYGAHFLAFADASMTGTLASADRFSQLGSGGSLRHPQVAGNGADRIQPMHWGPDPVASVTGRIKLDGGKAARLIVATCVAESLPELNRITGKYRSLGNIERAMMMSSSMAMIRFRELELMPRDWRAALELATLLQFTTRRVNIPSHSFDKRHIWQFGISGDRPLVLVNLWTAVGLELLRSILRVRNYFAGCGLMVDVLVATHEESSYLAQLHRDASAIGERMHPPQPASGVAAAVVAVMRAEDLREPTLETVRSLVTVSFSEDRRSWARQVEMVLKHHGDEPRHHGGKPDRPRPPQPSRKWIAWLDDRPVREPGRPLVTGALPSGLEERRTAPDGHFDDRNNEFTYSVSRERRPSAPWVNVIAQPGFGFVVSETGSGFTWAGNSRLNQLTYWSNDPITDPASEWWFLEDVDQQSMWNLTAGAHAHRRASYQVRHGQGYSVIAHTAEDLETAVTMLAAPGISARLTTIQIRNLGTRNRRIRIAAMAEWILGGHRRDRASVMTLADAQSSALYATQLDENTGFGGGTAFLASRAAFVQWSCDRTEFFDGDGQLRFPRQLSQRAGAGLDPCAAAVVECTLGGRQSAVVEFSLGYAQTLEQARQAVSSWQAPDSQASESIRTQCIRQWDDTLGRLTVETPDPILDRMVNRWLLYQTLGCRLWSRAGFYQAGGAIGFRDQLQDAMAFALTQPERLRDQILLHASRQFEAGDVQHWWHPPAGAGVRTRFSDDLLWLGFAAQHYTQVTQDDSLWDATTGFLKGPEVEEHAEDRYFVPEVSEEQASIYEHCARAIDRSLRFGAHGLPLIGSGDWNDGMNRVGIEGRGESVWLGWLLCAMLPQFGRLALNRGDAERATRWTGAFDRIRAALHDAGWDGQWFRRAFFDNGDALGSNANAECRIDLIAQAWSVISGASTPAFTSLAMRSVDTHLVDDRQRLVRLLTPAFQKPVNDPGYIQSYPAGVRENGGQYSHGAVWAVIAQALLGNGDRAHELWTYLSPAHRVAVEGPNGPYRVEPYVMPGDIYTEAPWAGRGGWSWYTGSSAWMYRAAVEYLLGVTKAGSRMMLRPAIPDDWPGFTVTYRVGDAVYRIKVRRDAPDPAAPDLAAPDPASPVLAPGEWFELSRTSGSHEIVVVL